MEITLSPLTAQRIRAALGAGVDLSPGTLPTALARLAVEAPTVYSQVLSEISGSQIRLDSERALQKRRWRGLLRRAFFWWGEYESDVGDRLLAKRHVAAAVPLGMAGVILVVLVLSAALGHRASSSSGHRVVAHKIPIQTHPRPVPPTAAPRRHLPRGIDTLAIADSSILAPAGSVPAGPALPSFQLSVPAVPAAVAAGPPGNPIVVNLPPSSPSAIPGAGRRQVVPAGISPIVYDRAAEDAAMHDRNADQSALSVRSDTGAIAQGGTAAGDLASRAHAWMPGQRIPARLTTGVVVVAGAPPMPVIAESADPSGTWLGHAALGPEGLVQITLTLVSAGPSHPVQGVAFDPTRLIPGLRGTTALRQPRAAAAILSAALQATAEYVQALAQQGQATIANGWAQFTVGSPGPAWTYVAARLAQGLEPSGGGAAPVETTEIAPGTPLVVLITEAP